MHFVKKLIEEKKYENIDPEVMEQIEADLVDRVEDRINATILERMPKEKMPEFEMLLNSGTPEEIQSFCEQSITDFPNVLAQAMMDFRKTYLGL